MKYIRRDIYTKRIVPFIDKPIIKVLTGQRRVGKSFVLYQLMDEIRSLHDEVNIVYISKEQEEFFPIQTHTDLLKYLKGSRIGRKKNYLFIDEIQEIESFQLALRTLLVSGRWDIYCTGSNANLLSGELATLLSGRYVSFTIHSLSYEEFLVFHKLDNKFEHLLLYLQYGGMPFLPVIGLRGDLPFEYLRNVYATVLLKDVVARENIRNVSFLESLVAYLADNAGSLFSATNISKFLKSQRIDISVQLTINYLRALNNAFIIHKVSRSEIGGLKIFEVGEKYYFEDLGMRNAIVGFKQRADMHKLLENAIYLHLIQREFTVTVGKLKDKEIDFVADKNGTKVYVQVCLSLVNADTAGREFGNLLQIPDNYPKYVVTLNDPIIGENQDGIFHKNLIDFLALDIG